jgi:hypothetical protein
MPCSDYRPTAEEEYDDNLREARQRANHVTRLLCSVLQELERRDLVGMVNGEVYGWWVYHKKEDEARLAREAKRQERQARREAAQQKQEAERQAVLAKLTPEERKALGI